MKVLARLTLFLTIFLAATPVNLLIAADVDPPIEQGVTGYGTNIIENGDFELGLDDTKWIEFPPESMSVIQSVYELVTSGSFAFKITEQDLPQWGTSGITQEVSVSPNELYTLKADILLKDTEMPGNPAIFTSLFTMEIWFLDEGGHDLGRDNYVDVNPPTAQYTTTELSGITPANASRAIVKLHLKASVAGGGGTVYIDNVKLSYDWAPHKLLHTSKTDTSIELSWSPPTDMSVFDHYEVYQDGQPILNGSTQSPYFKVTGLSPSKAYVFTVKAVTVNNSYVSNPSNSWRVATDSHPGYTTIMPLGDSLTHGWEVVGGYRYPLRDTLVANGLKVDFVGSQSTDSNPSQFDQEHEGHPGDKAEKIYEYIDQQAVIYEPDIILLLAGTNDMFDPVQAATAHSDIEAIISRIISTLPNTHVIVSSIPRILQAPDPATLDLRVQAFNADVKTFVEQHSNENMSFVDMYPMITEDYYQPPSDNPNVDRIHPTAAGFEVMSDVWYDAVHAIITGGPTKPQNLVQSPNSDKTVTLTWSASTDNSNRIYYDIFEGNNWVGTTAENVTQFTTSILTANTHYTFTVIARDEVGNNSEGKTLTFRTPAIIDTTPPTVPVLSQSTITQNNIALNWTSSSDNIAMSHYMLEIWNNGIQINEIFIVPTTYTFTNLVSDTEYSFIVKAFDWNQNSSVSQPLTIRTSKEIIPDPGPGPVPGPEPGPGPTPGPTPGPGTVTPPATLTPPNPEDQIEYQKSDDGIKLVYIPNKQKAIDTLNSVAKELAITVTPTKEKPFNQLELQLPSDILTIANSKNKPITISSGDFIIQLPPNFITIKAGDTVKLSVQINPSIVEDQLLEQSLSARSAMYELELKINNRVISPFNKPIQLTIIPTTVGGNHAQSGLYLYDPLTLAWSYIGGKQSTNGNMTAQLQHFSQYALLESTKTFNDITNHWARLDIESLAAKQIVSGLTADLFNPTGDVTRAQFAAMIARALQLKAVEGDLPFADVPTGAWYYSDVKAAYQAGVLSGVSEDQFAPNAQITREQMAVMIVNAYLHRANSTLDRLVAATTPISTYEDSKQISSWAQSYAEAAANLKLIFGIDGSFMPKQHADRAQSAAFINRLLNN